MVKMMIKNTPVMFALPPTSPNIPGFDVNIQSKILHLLHSFALFKARLHDFGFLDMASLEQYCSISE